MRRLGLSLPCQFFDSGFCSADGYSRITIDNSSRFLFFVFIPKTVENRCSHRHVAKKDVRIITVVRRGKVYACIMVKTLIENTTHYPNQKAPLPNMGKLPPPPVVGTVSYDLNGKLLHKVRDVINSYSKK